MNTLSEEATLSTLILALSEKGSTLKEKNLLPRGTNSFFLELIPFQKGLDVQESKQEVKQVISFVKNGRESPSVLSPLNSFTGKQNHSTCIGNPCFIFLTTYKVLIVMKS